MKTPILLTLLLIPFTLFCQDFEVRGIISNDLNLGVEGVELQNLRTKEKAFSNCDGNFKLIAKLGDTLKAEKRNFLNGEIPIINHRRIKFELDFDRNRIRKIFTDIMDNRYENPDDERRKLLISGQSAVTIIKDYDFDLGSINHMNENSIKNIDTLITLKKDYSINLLGDWGERGVVWIFMKCQK